MVNFTIQQSPDCEAATLIPLSHRRKPRPPKWENWLRVRGISIQKGRKMRPLFPEHHCFCTLSNRHLHVQMLSPPHCPLVLFKNDKRCPGWCGSVDSASACKPKGRRFPSHSGHMPGLRARSPEGGREKQPHIDISLLLSLPSPLSKNK